MESETLQQTTRRGTKKPLHERELQETVNARWMGRGSIRTITDTVPLLFEPLLRQEEYRSDDAGIGGSVGHDGNAKTVKLTGQLSPHPASANKYNKTHNDPGELYKTNQN